MNEEAILAGLIDWVMEILPDVKCEVIQSGEERILEINSLRNTTRMGPRIVIGTEGIEIDGKTIAWTRSDIQREFQRIVLIRIATIDSKLLFNNPKFAEAWRHIVTQDVRRENGDSKKVFGRGVG